MVLNLLLPFAGSALSAGATLAGSAMQSASQAKAARLNAMYQAGQNAQDRAINVDQFNAQMNMADHQFRVQQEGAALDRQLQEEFARNGVQWRVQDARAAGLHPLAALGAQLHSPSPVSISGNVPSAPNISSNPISPFVGNSSIAQAMSSVGQDLSRAMTAVATERERAQGIQTASSALSLENQALQNKLLASQIAKTSGAAVGPPMPSSSSSNRIPGQGNSGSRINTNLVEEQKHEPVVGAPGSKHTEPGEITDLGFARTKTGFAPVPSKDVKERIEDNLVSELMWEARNRITQTIGFGLTPPAHVKLKPGHEWRYNPIRQEYQQIIPLRQNGQWNVKNWWNQW